jgi:peptide/nickel transport system ATP-binding protein
MSDLLELRDVSKRFTTPLDTVGNVVRLFGAKVHEQTVHAVDHVSLSVAPGEVVGLVGESGCGKSTLARMAVGLHSLTGGSRWWHGQPMAPHQLQIQMIFQDPYASLNPRMRVQDIVGEAPLVHGLIKANEQQDYCAALLRRVGLDPALMRRFPHQFSGGQRARVGIARALAVKPDMLVCDEAVAALDVSIQAQVLNLFMDLRDELKLTYLFISHDLGVVRHVSDRVVIMYLGRVVEAAPVQELFSRPQHPYTQALLAAAPRLEVKKANFIPVRGEIPSPLNPPSGCHFHPRCPHAMERCKSEAPALRTVAPGHQAACHL